MTAPILVAYATRYGSTREVADSIGTDLREHGLTVDVLPVDDVVSIEDYGAVVLGAPLYVGHLHRDAREFLLWRQEDLAKVPIAMFILGPLSDDPKEIAGSREQLDHELSRFPWLDPVDVAIFVGKYDPARLGFLHKVMAALPTPLHGRPASDQRDWPATHAWADTLADTLETASVR